MGKLLRLTSKRICLLSSIECRMRNVLESLKHTIDSPRMRENWIDIVEESEIRYQEYLKGYSVIKSYFTRYVGFSSNHGFSYKEWSSEVEISDEEFFEGIDIVRGYLMKLSLDKCCVCIKKELKEEIKFLDMLVEKRIN